MAASSKYSSGPLSGFLHLAAFAHLAEVTRHRTDIDGEAGKALLANHNTTALAGLCLPFPPSLEGCAQEGGGPSYKRLLMDEDSVPVLTVVGFFQSLQDVQQSWEDRLFEINGFFHPNQISFDIPPDDAGESGHDMPRAATHTIFKLGEHGCFGYAP